MNLAKLKLQFVNDIISPWANLNLDLSKLILIDSGISSFSSNAINIATAINHFPEKCGFMPADIKDESQDYRIIRDVCDGSKHVHLRDSSRDNTINISAVFEGNNEGKYKFRRNKININHVTFGKIDFMKSAANAINFLINKFDYKIDWDSSLRIYDGKFIDKCVLWVSKQHHVQIEAKGNPLPNSWSVEFVRKNEEGELEHYDPPEQPIISWRELI
jgi:hypothetical protein